MKSGANPAQYTHNLPSIRKMKSEHPVTVFLTEDSKRNTFGLRGLADVGLEMGLKRREWEGRIIHLPFVFSSFASHHANFV